jgi:hypothetical protein
VEALLPRHGIRSIFLVTATLAGCRRSGDWEPTVDAAIRGPTFRIVDSVTLGTPDSVAIGQFAPWFARDGRADVLVADASVGRVLRFTPTGSFSAIIGCRGDGPGELEAPNHLIVLPGDSLLVVADPNRQRLIMFRMDGEYRRETTLPTAWISEEASWRGDTAVFGLNFSRGLIARWVVTGSGISVVGQTPSISVQASPAEGETAVVPIDSDYVALLPRVPGLLRLRSDGSAIELIHVPRARRLGQPHDLVAQHRRLLPARRGAMLNSMTLGLHRLASGDWLLLYLDADVTRTDAGVRGSRVRIFGTIVSADMSRACVDGIVPVATDAPSFPQFAGDTTYLMARTVGDDNRPHDRIVGVTVTTAGCQWVTTWRGAGP